MAGGYSLGNRPVPTQSGGQGGPVQPRKPSGADAVRRGSSIAAGPVRQASEPGRR